MKYDVKTKCKNCNEIFVLHECVAFEYPDDINFIRPTKEELEEINFVERAIGKSAYCEKCRQIGGLLSKIFWTPFEDIENNFLSAITIKNCDIPKAKGVYMIVYNGKKIPDFVCPSPAGWFKGKNPTVSIETLREKWVENAGILYIGRAKTLKANLHHRMKQHINFWSGKPIGAWGGRIIAQIKGYENLQVWYMECENPIQKETELLDLFKKHYGKLPFANWKMGDK